MSDNEVKRNVKKRFIIVKKKKVTGPITLENVKNEPIQPIQPQCVKERYLLTLTDEEKETYKIAKEHLLSSFNLEKSVGFFKYNV